MGWGFSWRLEVFITQGWRRPTPMDLVVQEMDIAAPELLIKVLE